MTVIPLNSRDPRDPDRNATGKAEKVDEKSTTRARARVREERPNATPTATTSRHGVRAPSQARDRFSGFLELVRPPELWSEPRPSLQQVWNYAAYGPWTDQSRTTPARVAGAGYGAFVVALTAVGYSLLWVAERPARVAVAGLLTVLAYLSWLI